MYDHRDSRGHPRYVARLVCGSQLRPARGLLAGGSPTGSDPSTRASTTRWTTTTGAAPFLAGAKGHHIDRGIAAFSIWAQQKSSAAEKAAQELREIAIRHILNPQVPLPRAVRWKLRGDWAFDEIYTLRGGELRNAPALRRRLGMAKMLLTSPELFVAPVSAHMVGRSCGAGSPARTVTHTSRTG